jgi:hypothetical protein
VLPVSTLVAQTLTTIVITTTRLHLNRTGPIFPTPELVPKLVESVSAYPTISQSTWAS